MEAAFNLTQLVYTVGKDTKRHVRTKKEYCENLTNNNDKLCKKLRELLGLISDVKAYEEDLRLRTTIKAWLTTARKIKEEAEGLVDEYNNKILLASFTRRTKRAKLSKEMEEKYDELHKHMREGILLSIPQ